MKLHHLLAALLLTPVVCMVFVSVWVGFVLLDAAGVMTTKLLSALRAGDIFEFIGNQSPKCPHCGQDYDISEGGSYQVYEEGEHELLCPSCDNDFTLHTNVKYTFSTDSQD